MQDLNPDIDRDITLSMSRSRSSDPLLRKKEFENQLSLYQTNLSPQAAEKLISMFMPYLLNWLGFLTRTSRLAHVTPYVLLLRHPCLRILRGNLSSKHHSIVDSLRKYDRDDLFNDVCLAFLKACLQSENIVYGLPFHLAPQVRLLIQDPLSFGGRCLSIDVFQSDGSEGGEVATAGMYHSNVFSSVNSLRSTLVSESPDSDDWQEFGHELGSRTAGVEVGECGLEDLVKVTERGDGLLGVVLSREWVGGLSVGMGGGDAFQSLSEHEREILLRFYVAKQTHEKIREDMNISHRHSRTLLARARRRLAEALEARKD